MTSTSSPLLPSRTFKPHFIHDSFLTSNKLSKQDLSKRNYKYIHSFQINEEQSCCFKIISRLKSISTVSLDYKSELPSTSLLKKLFKFHQKCLKSLGRNLQYIGFLKLLPLLDNLNLSEDQAYWRILTSRSAFKTLIFDFEGDSKPTIQNFFQYRASLRRNLPKMRNLSSLRIRTLNEDIDLILSMLEVISEKVHLKLLKDFDLSIKPSDDSHNYHEILEQKPERKIKKALRSLTKLSIDDSERYSFLFSLAKFKNLSDLQLNYHPEEEEEVETFRQIAHLEDLPNLKKFALSFRARSFPCEAQFFEHFIFPPTVEHLGLILTGFEWSERRVADDDSEGDETPVPIFKNNPRYIQFFERIESSCQNVKTLKLYINFTEKIHAAVTGRFARLFIKRFTKLEQIDCQAYYYYEDPYSEQENTIKQPLDLQDLWKGLKSSKKTLASISIQADIINFPENIEAFENRFPKLESLTFRGEILCPVELGAFCSNLPGLKHIFLRDLMVADKEDLKRLLLSFKKIPQDVKVEIHLNVKGVKQQGFIDCLEEYIQKAKIRGVFKLWFDQVHVIHIMAFEKILNGARKKGFEELSLVSNANRSILLIQKAIVKHKMQGLRVF